MDIVEESLVNDLGAGKVGMSLPLTEKQEAMGISQHLVYICGMVTNGNQPPFSSLQEQRFELLQTLYQSSLDTNETECSPCVLTPALIPSEKAQRMIDRDTAQRQTVMTEKANAMAKKLMKEETLKADEQAAKKNRKQSRNIEDFRRSIDSAPTETDESPPMSPVAEKDHGVLSPIRVLRHDNEQQSDPWIEVTKKRPQPSKPVCTPSSVVSSGIKKNDGDDNEMEDELREIASKPIAPEKDKPALGDANRGGDTHHDGPTKTSEMAWKEPLVSSTTIEDVCSEIVGDVSTMDRSAHHDPSDMKRASARIKALEEEVQKLKLAIIDRDEKLAAAEIAHKRAMQTEKESGEEKIQALQLRLFIGETRLKTYQEALAQHVETISSSMSNVNTTPERDDGEEVSTPLFSRGPSRSKA